MTRQYGGVYYLLAASAALRSAARRAVPVLLWTALISLLLSPYACAYLLGRVTA